MGLKKKLILKLVMMTSHCERNWLQCDNFGDNYETSDKLLKQLRGDQGVKEETDSEDADDDRPFDKFLKAKDSGHIYRIAQGQTFVSMSLLSVTIQLLPLVETVATNITWVCEDDNFDIYWNELCDTRRHLISCVQMGDDKLFRMAF